MKMIREMARLVCDEEMWVGPYDSRQSMGHVGGGFGLFWKGEGRRFVRQTAGEV